MFARHTTIDYPFPLSPGESEVAVASYFIDVGRKSCTMRQVVQDSVGRITCTIDAVMVGIDVMTGKSREWSEQDVNNINQFLIPEDHEVVTDRATTAARFSQRAFSPELIH